MISIYINTLFNCQRHAIIARAYKMNTIVNLVSGWMHLKGIGHIDSSYCTGKIRYCLFCQSRSHILKRSMATWSCLWWSRSQIYGNGFQRGWTFHLEYPMRGITKVSHYFIPLQDRTKYAFRHYGGHHPKLKWCIYTQRFVWPTMGY